MPPKTYASCGISARSAGSASVAGTPPRVTAPPAGVRSPAASSDSVDLPMPLGPTTARWSPSVTRSDRSSITGSAYGPYAKVTPHNRRSTAAATSAASLGVSARTGVPAEVPASAGLHDAVQRHRQPQAAAAQTLDDRGQRGGQALQHVRQRAEHHAGRRAVPDQPWRRTQEQQQGQPPTHGQRHRTARGQPRHRPRRRGLGVDQPPGLGRPRFLRAAGGDVPQPAGQRRRRTPRSPPRPGSAPAGE